MVCVECGFSDLGSKLKLRSDSIKALNVFFVINPKTPDLMNTICYAFHKNIITLFIKTHCFTELTLDFIEVFLRFL